MNRKPVIAAALGIVLALGLYACGSSSSASSQSAQASSSAVSSSSASASASSESSASSGAAIAKFDGSGFSDTGDGSFYLNGPGGNNEDGHVLQIASRKSITFMQIDACFSNGDGSVGTVYIDGIENMKMNAAANEYRTIMNLEGDALAPGVHTVEFVRMEGDNPAIYKKSQYEIIV